MLEGYAEWNDTVLTFLILGLPLGNYFTYSDRRAEYSVDTLSKPMGQVLYGLILQTTELSFQHLKTCPMPPSCRVGTCTH